MRKEMQSRSDGKQKIEWNFQDKAVKSMKNRWQECISVSPLPNDAWSQMEDVQIGNHGDLSAIGYGHHL